MKLPTWIPQISKPFNPAYRDTWDAMSPNERRWSFLFDAGVVGAVLTAAWYFSR